MLRSLFVAAVVVSSGAFQAGTGPAAPVYNAKFTVATDQGNRDYVGTTTFAVDTKGVVTGKMDLTQPTVVTATLGGTVKAGTWTVDYSYEIPAQNCTGIVKGTGTVPADKKTISGSVTIQGGCTEAPLTATFSFTLQEKKGS